MKTLVKTFVLLMVVAALVVVVGFMYLMRTGLRAIDQPGALETSVARRLRGVVIARHARDLRNPIEATAEHVAEGRAHFADHCAVCHGNDGGGNTDMGRGLFPKAPDMRRTETQSMTDGELFYIIENGIRFTGMPGWSTGTKDGEATSWRLVHFIRHLPRITPAEIAEMDQLNPKSAEEWRQLQQEREFLEGGTTPTATRPAPHHSGAQQ